MENLNQDNLNRLALSIMEQRGYSYEEACSFLDSLTLSLYCSPDLQTNVAYQAAMLTAVNCGKRAFLGGVNVIVDENVPCVLKWPEVATLADALRLFGATINNPQQSSSFKLMFGSGGQDDSSLQVVCNSWQGGIVPYNEVTGLDQSEGSLPLGGVAAAAMAVGSAFLKVSGIDITAGDCKIGISMWRPDLSWDSPLAAGPIVNNLPAKFWILGLGHLGQAYLWNIALLPYANFNDVTIQLQDFDKVTKANESAGLICPLNGTKEVQKTRLCASWLEEFGFRTIITERKFDEHTRRMDEEPFLALCGFDAVQPRMYLENAGFDLVIEAGIGGALNSFDDIAVHVFPNSERPPKKVWGQLHPRFEVHSTALAKFAHLDKEGCGIISQTLASKAISTSFVGALAGAMVIGEAVRGLNGGMKFEKMSLQIRNIESSVAAMHKDGNYATEHAKNGFAQV